MHIQDDFIKMATEIVQKNIDKIIHGIFQLGSDKYNKIKVQTEQVFQKYLESAIDKYSQIKTILYRDEPVNLYSFYVDVDLAYRKKKNISSKSINNILKISNYIIITGIAGCGKSTLLKHLFLNSLETGLYIPIYVELKNLNNLNMGLIDYIYRSIYNLEFNMEKKYFELALSKGKFIFFLDGFDELNPDIRGSITTELQNIRDKYRENAYIVSSRPDQNEFVSWNKFTELKVQSLNKEQITKLVSKIDYDIEVKNSFLEELDNLLTSHYSFISNPLLLTIMIMTFSQFADIPSKLYIFYEQAFETLYCKHDATKGGYKRIMNTKMPIDDFKSILASFSILTYYKKIISFNKNDCIKYLQLSKKITHVEFDGEDYFNDLVKSVCILIQDGLLYTYSHRTFQEYFTAIYILNSKESIRKELLKKLLEDNNTSLHREKVLELLFEMNREIVETNLIIPTLKELKKVVSYDRIDKKLTYKKYIKLIAYSINISKGNLDVDREEDNKVSYTVNKEWYYYTLILFLKDYYLEHFETYELVAADTDNQVINYQLLEKYDDNIKHGIEDDLEINIDLNTLRFESNAWDEILKLSNVITDRLDISMSLLETLETRNKNKDKSIEDILFR